MSSHLVTHSLLPASSMRPIAHMFTSVDFSSTAFRSMFATSLQMNCHRHNPNMCGVSSACICFATLATALAACALCPAHITGCKPYLFSTLMLYWYRPCIRMVAPQCSFELFAVSDIKLHKLSSFPANCRIYWPDAWTLKYRVVKYLSYLYRESILNNVVGLMDITTGKTSLSAKHRSDTFSY